MGRGHVVSLWKPARRLNNFCPFLCISLVLILCRIKACFLPRKGSVHLMGMTLLFYSLFYVYYPLVYDHAAWWLYNFTYYFSNKIIVICFSSFYIPVNQFRIWVDGVSTIFQRICAARPGEGSVKEEMIKMDRWVCLCLLVSAASHTPPETLVLGKWCCHISVVKLSINRGNNIFIVFIYLMSSFHSFNVVIKVLQVLSIILFSV